MPERIQLHRTKGWRLPPNTVVVSRPSVFGNPWKRDECGSAQHAVDAFRRYVVLILKEEPHWLDVLRGHDLACWCKPGDPCHADVLLELANK